jgi:hypothetical protein
MAEENEAFEENKALLRRVIEEAHSKGNMDVVDEVYASDYVLHTPTPPLMSKYRVPRESSYSSERNSPPPPA